MTSNPLPIIEQATTEDFVALLVARNRVGASIPLEELLHRYGVPLEDFQELAKQTTFHDKIKQQVESLTKTGFGVEEKAAILHEAGLPVLYEMLNNEDLPASARLKAHEMLGDISGKSKKNPDAFQPGAGPGRYQLTIIIGDTKETHIASPTANIIDATPTTIAFEDESMYVGYEE